MQSGATVSGPSLDGSLVQIDSAPEPWASAASLTPAANREWAMAESIRFFDQCQPGHAEQLQKMLPTPCSPSGTGPATHFLCWWRAKLSLIEAAIRWCQSQTDPRYKTHIVERAASREAFLASRGLKVIGE